MTPRAKADQLLIKFKMSECTEGYNDVRDLHAANRCAIILVNEMLSNAAMIWGGRNTETGLTARDEFRKYWYEVKNELEKYDT
jgi:hypothetical protein